MPALTWTPIIDGNGVTKRATVGSDFVAGTFTGTQSSSEGMSLHGVGGFAVYVEAESTRTITTAGGALAYVQDPWDGLWARAEIYDISPGTVTGVRSVLAGAFVVHSPAGRIAYLNNGFTASAGTLAVRIIPTSTYGFGFGTLL